MGNCGLNVPFLKTHTTFFYYIIKINKIIIIKYSCRWCHRNNNNNIDLKIICVIYYTLMADLNIILDYIHDLLNKKSYKKYNTNFTCDRVYVGCTKENLKIGNDYSVYLISGEFIPFLFSNNKIYNIDIEDLHDYYKHCNYKNIIYKIQQKNEET